MQSSRMQSSLMPPSPKRTCETLRGTERRIAETVISDDYISDDSPR
jgi:hypothetical protein